MFSLLHFLASHPRNADTLKRALHGDADARRLFSFLGVTPTHLEAIDEGAIARRSAAVSVPRTVEVTAPKPEQTPPEEVIVLGPRSDYDNDGHAVRLVLNGQYKGGAGLRIVADHRNSWTMLRLDGGFKTRYDQCEQDAEKEARKTYALIDAEPGSLSGTLSVWRSTYGRYHEAHWSGGFLLIDDYSQGSGACPGWRIVTVTSAHPKGAILAEGPQTGEEGKRYALAAAHACGLTGGGE
jgi:hypothetical protein